MTTSTPSTPEEKRAAGLAKYAIGKERLNQREEEQLEYLRSILQGSPVRPLREKEGRQLLSLIMKGKMSTLGLKAVLGHPDLPEHLLRKVAGRHDYVNAEIADQLLKHPHKSIELEILVVRQLRYHMGVLALFRKAGQLSLTEEDVRLVEVTSALWGQGDHTEFVELVRRVLQGDPTVREVFQRLLDDRDGWRELSLLEKRRRLRELVGISEYI